MRTPLPDGRTSHAYLAKLNALEEHAKKIDSEAGAIPGKQAARPRASGGNFIKHVTLPPLMKTSNKLCGRALIVAWQIIVVIIAVGLTSCASEPATPAAPIKFLTRSRVERFIHKGVTTKAQVISEFGAPSAEVVMNSSDLPGVPYETSARAGLSKRART